MSVVDYLLDGLEAELVLERELGLRSLECDRKLLGTAAPAAAGNDRRQPTNDAASRSSPAASRPSIVASCPSPVACRPSPAAVPAATPAPAPAPSPAASRPQPVAAPAPSGRAFDFVFLHDRPLSQGGIEMMSKIITALGKTADTAPIVITPPLPKAKFYVVLGGLAMRKFFPEMKGEPGQWCTSERGHEVLVTYSPAYILRFKEVTPAVKKIKQDMWLSLKAMLKKI